jgi:hypothetical protein
MRRFSARARKYMVALGGIALLIGLRYLDIEIPGLPEAVRDTLVGLAAAEGVYQVSNGAG